MRAGGKSMWTLGSLDFGVWTLGSRHREAVLVLVEDRNRVATSSSSALW